MTDKQQRLQWTLIVVLAVVLPLSLCAQFSGFNDRLRASGEDAAGQAGSTLGNAIGSAILFLSVPIRNAVYSVVLPATPTAQPSATARPSPTATPRPVFVIPTLTP